MKGLIAVLLSASLTMNVSVGNSSIRKSNTIETKKVQLSAEEIKGKIAEVKLEEKEDNDEYIKYVFNNIIENIDHKTRSMAIDVVAAQFELDPGQLTVGKMNNNVYLVNFFDDVEEVRIVNLYLVVNGEVVDMKYNADNTLSETFVENFMKYQEVDPVEEYIANYVIENQDKDENLAAEGVANLIAFKKGCSLRDIKVLKIDEHTYACDFKFGNATERVVVKDGIIQVEEEMTTMMAGL